MSLEFSRRSFLKYTAVAAVAVAGAGLFSGCEDTDPDNLYCIGPGQLSILQVTATMGTYDKNAKKYADISLNTNALKLPFEITVARDNNLPITPSNFKAIVYDKDGKQKAKYVGSNSHLIISQSLLDTNLATDQTVSGAIQLILDAPLKAKEKVVLTYIPDLAYAKFSLNWVLTQK